MKRHLKGLDMPRFVKAESQTTYYVDCDGKRHPYGSRELAEKYAAYWRSMGRNVADEITTETVVLRVEEKIWYM